MPPESQWSGLLAVIALVVIITVIVLACHGIGGEVS